MSKHSIVDRCKHLEHGGYLFFPIICYDNIEEAGLEFSNLHSIHVDDQFILVGSGELAIEPFKCESNFGSI